MYIIQANSLSKVINKVKHFLSSVLGIPKWINQEPLHKYLDLVVRQVKQELNVNNLNGSHEQKRLDTVGGRSVNVHCKKTLNQACWSYLFERCAYYIYLPVLCTFNLNIF